ncbi:uncharacterized protein LOC133187829 [Saccostrea echinata]|uniref:uncharacterized protein LOC133187829 n=1 Tax=Saccostrea echinata TaxID=191078 RepID=UPI002A82E49D|nr:uncharacterized protein LOC133187829 [Saccostrea echinata]
MDLLFIVVTYCSTVTALHPKFNYYAQQIHRRHKRAFVEKADCQKMIEKNGMDMINYGIEVLSNGTEKYEGRFFESLQSVFMLLQKKRNDTKWTIAESLRNQYRTSYNTLRRSRDQLESSLIQLYTADEIYNDLSGALGQHDCTTKALSPKDRALAPYATALFATMLYWGDLMTTGKTTYRGIGNISGDMTTVLKAYQKGESIVLPQFTSSSELREVAMETFLAPNTDKNIFLIIDNSQASEWRPKGISQYSYYDEREFLFPPAAKFKVLSDPVKKTVKIGQNSGNQRTFYEIKLRLKGISLKHKIRKKLRKICPWIKEK